MSQHFIRRSYPPVGARTDDTFIVSYAQAAIRLLLVVLIGIGLGLVTVRASGEDKPPAQSAPNLLLIVLDTLRADHLSCYGYPRKTSPRIDAFAKRASLYRKAMATASWTLPTHASLFTGLFPFEHGAHTYKGPPGARFRPLHESHITLAEILQKEGFEHGQWLR